MENMYKAWERHKELLHGYLHHELLDWLQLQTFYNGLTNATRTFMNTITRGSLIGKKYRRCL